MARNARFIPFVLFLSFPGLAHSEGEPVVVTATRTAQTVDAGGICFKIAGVVNGE